MSQTQAYIQCMCTSNVLSLDDSDIWFAMGTNRTLFMSWLRRVDRSTSIVFVISLILQQGKKVISEEKPQLFIRLHKFVCTYM